MVTSLKEINSFVADAVYQTVFLRDAPRPTAGQQMSKWLGLARALEWIAHHRFDQIQRSDCGASVGFHPVSQVLPELRMKDRDPLTFPLHPTSLAAIQPRLRALFSLARLDAVQPTTVVRFGATGASGRSR
jgi:hypothetical protein